GEHPDDVDGDVAVADDHHSLPKRGSIARIGMRVQHPGNCTGTVHTVTVLCSPGETEHRIGMHSRSQHRRVVSTPEVVQRHIDTETHVASEADSVLLE